MRNCNNRTSKHILLNRIGSTNFINTILDAKLIKQHTLKLVAKIVIRYFIGVNFLLILKKHSDVFKRDHVFQHRHSNQMRNRDEYMKEHPDSNVFVLNSLSAGPELKLIVEKALELNNKGVEFEQMCNELDKYINKTGLVFSLECLNNLARNGRVNPVVAKAAGLLGIRIVGKASEVGDLKPMDKPRGEERAYAKLFDRMISESYNGGKVRIDHCYNEKGANRLKKLILSKYKNADVKIDITYGLCSFYAENGGMLVAFDK